MMGITVWTLRFIVCLLCCRTSLAELKLLQTIFRHGNKMPSQVNIYPNDPYVNYTYEPAGKGGLTNVRNNIIFYIITFQSF